MEGHLRDWLMQGDPAIRWQVLRDLLDAPPEECQAERARVAQEGWGADLLARQDAGGTWGGGLYSPKWTSTTYTLLDLRHFGLSPGNAQATAGCHQLLARGIHRDGGINLFKSLDYSETCINGMLLTLFAYFRIDDDRIHSVAQFLLGEQMPDGGWNCERIHGATHSSFHTTISVLEGLYEYSNFHNKANGLEAAMQRGCEFLLAHRLFRSHRTGEVVDAAMTRMNFPPRWHYDFIRALDQLRATGAGQDERMQDAIDLLHKKRRADGRWPAYRPYSGRMYFMLEAAGQPSRWNTLRGLRVLRWWEQHP